MMMKVLAVLLAASRCSLVNGDVSDHRYKQGEHVELWVNKVREKSEKKGNEKAPDGGGGTVVSAVT
jgi:hypothetical protein